VKPIAITKCSRTRRQHQQKLNVKFAKVVKLIRKTGTAAARAGVARKNSHTGEYELRTQKQSEKPATPYSIKSKYSENEKIQHVKFGVGFVQKTYDEKIDVIFVDEVKSLIQNRK
jgi:hypothetical protein